MYCRPAFRLVVVFNAGQYLSALFSLMDATSKKYCRCVAAIQGRRSPGQKLSGQPNAYAVCHKSVAPIGNPSCWTYYRTLVRQGKLSGKQVRNIYAHHGKTAPKSLADAFLKTPTTVVRSAIPDRLKARRIPRRATPVIPDRLKARRMVHPGVQALKEYERALNAGNPRRPKRVAREAKRVAELAAHIKNARVLPDTVKRSPLFKRALKYHAERARISAKAAGKLARQIIASAEKKVVFRPKLASVKLISKRVHAKTPTPSKRTSKKRTKSAPKTAVKTRKGTARKQTGRRVKL